MQQTIQSYLISWNFRIKRIHIWYKTRLPVDLLRFSTLLLFFNLLTLITPLQLFFFSFLPINLQEVLFCIMCVFTWYENSLKLNRFEWFCYTQVYFQRLEIWRWNCFQKWGFHQENFRHLFLSIIWMNYQFIDFYWT